MAEVYWIRLSEHKDIFSEGYVGITKLTAIDRYKGHVYASNKNDNQSIIGNAIRKYGSDKLIVETLVVCSLDYAAWLENKLRPFKGIGWNMAPGGEYPGGDRVITDTARENMRKAQLGRKHSEESKKKISEATSKLRLGSKHSDETRLKISKATLGRKMSKESVEMSKMGKFYFYLKSNRDVYSKAIEFYKAYSNGVSAYKTEKNFLMPKGSLESIFKHFKNGWNPNEDIIWKEYYMTDNEESLWPMS